MDQSALDGPSRTGKKPAHSPPIGEIQELESIAGTTVLNSAGTDEICMKKPPDGSQEVATTDVILIL